MLSRLSLKNSGLVIRIRLGVSSGACARLNLSYFTHTYWRRTLIPMGSSRSSECSLLKRANEQYLKALTEFFVDVAVGSGSIVDHKHVIPRKIVDTILSQSRFKTLSALRELWKERGKDDGIFSLGPDSARAE